MSADVEELINEFRALPAEDQQRVRAALFEQETVTAAPPQPVRELTDTEYQQQLFASGLLKKVKPRRRNQQAFNRFDPVEISGKPLSETIVEERR